MDELFCSIYSEKLTPNLLEELTSFSTKLSHSYIWHNQPFALESSPDSSFIKGSTNFGDNIQDEWFTVYILHQISLNFDVAISLSDNDGQFLLIEAANHLPNWLSPSNSDNRIFIYKGNLHIIPESVKCPTLKESLNLVFKNQESTLASPEIQKSALLNISTYPQKALENALFARVTIPKRLLFILQKHPQSISKAVSTFYNRDPYSIRKLISINPVDFVTSRIELTRCMYAQLSSQFFKAPNCFFKGDGVEFDIGVKITCGFEMVFGIEEDSFKKHLLVLERDGYFDSYKSDSMEYLKLLDDARLEFFKDSISGLMNDYDPENVVIDHGLSDSLDFLNIDESALSTELSRLESQLDPTIDLDDEDYSDEVGKIISGVGGFLHNKSDVDGVVFEDQVDSDDESDSDDYSEDEDETFQNTADVSFDDSKFMESLSRILNLQDSEYSTYMDQLQNELNEKVKVDGSFEVDQDGDIDVATNLVKNLVESMDSANGMFGPADGILKGIR